jgi:tRNA U54 and U55 pseudouridine synthase Pus10
MENLGHTQTKIQEYFDQTDTPSVDSPVGQVMRRVLVKFPGITFQAARNKAHELLDDAAKRKNYRVLVFSEAEIDAQQVRVATYWKQRSETVQATA